MSDLINRQKAIDIFHVYAPGIPWKKLNEIFSAIPSSQHWTPTASHLPDPGRYLVTVKRYGKKGNKTSVSNYNEGTWSGYDAEDVLAWMPMPEPMEGDA